MAPPITRLTRQIKTIMINPVGHINVDYIPLLDDILSHEGTNEIIQYRGLSEQVMINQVTL